MSLLRNQPRAHAQPHRRINHCAMQGCRIARRQKHNDVGDLFRRDQSMFGQGVGKRFLLLWGHRVERAGLKHRRVGGAGTNGEDID